MDLARYKVWVRDSLAYHPVRKSASSSLQYAFGGRPVDMREVEEGIIHFSLVRNPFDRLASLYANNLNYYPFTEHGIYKGMSLSEFVDCVCETREPQCDHHLWEANHCIPKSAEVFYFEDLLNEIERLNQTFDMNLKLRHFGLTKTPKPDFTEAHLDRLSWRYRHDLERFYENNTDPESCRVGGQAAARLRQRDTQRVDGFNSVRDRTASADSSPE